MTRAAAIAMAVVLTARVDAGAVPPDPGPLVPVSVATSLHGTTAQLDARYAVVVDGPEVMVGLAELAPPSRGVAIGGSIAIDGHEHRLVLATSPDVERRFDALMTRTTNNDRGWFVALRGQADRLFIDVAVPHHATIDLHVRFSAPTCFFHDVRYVAVPASWRAALPPPLVVDGLDVACHVPHDHVWAAFPTDELAARPARIAATASRLATGDVDFAAVELSLSGELASVPHDLATAIVVDASRSMTPEQLVLQRRVVEAYLRAAPGGIVQIIAMARTAWPLLPSWMPISLARPRIDRELGALVPRNGSNLDAALIEATSWLARVPGTHRIVVLTDERLAGRIAGEPAGALHRFVDVDTVVHVVALDEAGDELVQDDDGQLAGLAQATEGIAIRVGPVDAIDATVLARPLELDALEFEAPGWEPIDSTSSCGGSLAAGASCRWFGRGNAASEPISISARLWGHRFERVVRPDPAHALDTARELAVEPMLDSADDGAVAKASRAVGNAWSLGASWGGPGGYGDVGGHGRGFATFIERRPVRDNAVRIGRSPGPRRVPPGVDVRGQLEQAIASCGGEHHRVEVSLELTLHEITDVDVAVVARLGDSRPLEPLHDCIVEAVWQLELVSPHVQPRSEVHLAIGPR